MASPFNTPDKGKGVEDFFAKRFAQMAAVLAAPDPYVSP